MGTKSVILKSAQEEFILKGFANASMRDIASKVGISATALYRYYSNKEDLFAAVILPAVTAWESFCESEYIWQTDLADKKGLDAMWNDNVQIRMMVDLIYD